MISRLVALDQLSVGGSSSRRNEDAIGCTRAAAWVVDGATSLDASRNWGQTSARWMATTTSLLLADLAAARPGLDSRGLIRGVVDGLSVEWSDLVGNDDTLLPPAGSLGLVVHDATQDLLELVTVGDCVIVWSSSRGGNARVLTDLDTVESEKATTRRIARHQPSASDLREESVKNRHLYVAGKRGWIISTNPRVVESVEPVVVKDPVGDLILIASDGFARCVELPEFDNSWISVLGTIRSEGLAFVLSRLRKQESESPYFGVGRYKMSDDASALLLQVGATSLGPNSKGSTP